MAASMIQYTRVYIAYHSISQVDLSTYLSDTHRFFCSDFFFANMDTTSPASDRGTTSSPLGSDFSDPEQVQRKGEELSNKIASYFSNVLSGFQGYLKIADPSHQVDDSTLAQMNVEYCNAWEGFSEIRRQMTELEWVILFNSQLRHNGLNSLQVSAFGEIAGRREDLQKAAVEDMAKRSTTYNDTAKRCAQDGHTEVAHQFVPRPIHGVSLYTLSASEFTNPEEMEGVLIRWGSRGDSQDPASMVSGGG